MPKIDETMRNLYSYSRREQSAPATNRPSHKQTFELGKVITNH